MRTHTSAPRARNTLGAMAQELPLAQSRAIFLPLKEYTAREIR